MKYDPDGKWEYDKVYNIANDSEFYLYLKRIDDIASGRALERPREVTGALL